MYQVGENVVYGIHGVCRIVDVEIRKIDGKTVEYLVLVPSDQSVSRFLVPRGNAAAMAKLRPVMTREDLERLLAAPEVRCDGWIADENQRKQYYRQVINSGDRRALLRTVHTLHAHRRQQQALGRKFHLCDENFLRDAQRLLSAEFSVVLEMTPAEAESYIVGRLER